MTSKHSSGMPGAGGDEASTPAHRAQDLIYEAWDIPSPSRRQEMAREALALWPDCADAYVLLAEAEEDLAVKLAFLKQGVAAGERALGPATFQEDAGDFWGLLETRPYMRARAGLASCLWKLGRREEAVAHLQDMLRLNPGDNQGLRYALASHLAELGQDDALAGLLRSYEDDASSMWDYTRALLAFRQGGDSPEAREQLNEARQSNPHVPDLLLRLRRMPRALPGSYSFGTREEAILYVAEGRAAWDSTPDALDWLASVCGVPRAPTGVTTVPGVDVRELLIQCGEHLPERDRQKVLALGSAGVPVLVDILEDEDLAMTDGPGQGWAPIHAARLLRALKAGEAAPDMARVLGTLTSDLILFSELIPALAAAGPAAAPAILQALDLGEAEEETGLLEALARCGVRSEAIFARLLDRFREDPELGAIFFAEYGDPRALPLLYEAFDAHDITSEDGFFANQVLLELEDAIRELGGTLSPAQARKLDEALRRRPQLAGPQPIRRRERPERNAPCWCGSGTKYKKCHLAEDEGRGDY